MARRIVTPSQWNGMVRQAQQRQRQAIDAMNRDIRAHNQKVAQAVNEHNRKAREHNRKVDQAIDTYNREVRAHNARVRADRQRLKSELERLARQAAAPRYVSFRVSVNAVQTAYERLDRVATSGGLDERYNEVLDLSEREAANNAGLMNALLEGGSSRAASEPPSAESPLTAILQAVSADLGNRWRGALFSLNPQNPDAARHFCASAREIIAGILDAKAPDSAVLGALPGCDRTPAGTPTRRSKIRYFLHLKGMNSEELGDFVEADMNNVVELFPVFNKGTHGTAGAFDFAQLHAMRQRVEHAIAFLTRIIS